MDTVPPRKRRKRYSGTHPRHFDEKYKELSPGRYAADIEKVMQRGQTPAGMHRPICVQEMLNVLDPRPGMTVLDATLGYGGHAQELLRRIVPGGRLIGIDVDPIELPRTESRLRALGFGQDVLTIRRMNFAGILQLPHGPDDQLDIVIADLGVSSMQIDNPSRGFSFKLDGPLDLRLNPNKGVPASELLQNCSHDDLVTIFAENSDEPHAAIIAAALIRNKGQIRTTRQLADCIRQALLHLPVSIRLRDTKKSVQRSFQALRIAVNDEFGALDQFLDHIPACIKPGGKVAILTFHSGEDRRVKKSFQAGVRRRIYKEIAREPIRPSAQEQLDNPRSTSAKLRWATRAGP